jgi:hypothetical protein
MDPPNDPKPHHLAKKRCETAPFAEYFRLPLQGRHATLRVRPNIEAPRVTGILSNLSRRVSFGALGGSDGSGHEALVQSGHNGRPGPGGQVLVLFAVGIFVLVGAVGLGIDGSRTFEERRAAQTAVDHAATAAAYASCIDDPDDLNAIRAAGRLAATRNGYNDAAASIVVTVDPVVVSGVPVPDTFRAAIDSTIPGTFSRVLGINDFTVSVEAIAGGVDCDAGDDGPGAIFAGGTCPAGKWGVEIGASDSQVFGGIHTNAHATTHGENNEFYQPGDPDDPFTYVETHVDHDPPNLFQTPTYPVDEGSKPWPADWEPSDITGAPDGVPEVGSFLRPYYDLAYANGTFFTGKVESITKDGVYYTTSEDGMVINNIDWSVANDRTVVLVATRGPISISLSPDVGKTLHAFEHASLPRQDILVLANEQYGNDADRCSKDSIRLSGQQITWDGILWGPGGMINISGSDDSSVTGSLVSWSVNISGQRVQISYTPAGTPGSEPSVLVLK